MGCTVGVEDKYEDKKNEFIYRYNSALSHSLRERFVCLWTVLMCNLTCIDIYFSLLLLKTRILWSRESGIISGVFLGQNWPVHMS